METVPKIIKKIFFFLFIEIFLNSGPHSPFNTVKFCDIIDHDIDSLSKHFVLHFFSIEKK